MVELLQASPERIDPPCTLYGNCGGCQLQHGRYRWQLAAKRLRVAEALERIGKFRVRMEDAGEEPSGAASCVAPEKAEVPVLQTAAAPPDGKGVQDRPVVVHPVQGMEDPWRYRNKVYMAVESREGDLVTGFYRPGGRHLVPAEDCPIADERLIRLIRAGREAALRCGWTSAPSGRLRHLAARVAPGTGQTMLIAVADTDRLPGLEEFAAAVRERVPEVTSIILNVRRGPAEGPVFGRRSLALFGPVRIVDRLCGLMFEISPTSFYQVNAAQADLLYRLAVGAARLTGSEFAVDAYCGVGTISLFLARRAARVVGIEAVAEAVEDARRNARLNGIRNAEFTAGAVEDVLPGLAAERRPDVVVLDPPRRGCRWEVLESLIRTGVPRVVYVSCDPATLARDLRILADGGYRVCEVWPVDLFPQTGHVESVALLTREVPLGWRMRV
ncbi:MAG: 23S rRNA (uracil(1939)-C(5))-methyltransferase RlmD [Alicyclobacillaceae bacterium]|nr:23S rRNA (uracil(1939)-C(5))-methyltransferase RlmD [Alicyclobacillaceae bacterium]